MRVQNLPCAGVAIGFRNGRGANLKILRVFICANNQAIARGIIINMIFMPHLAARHTHGRRFWHISAHNMAFAGVIIMRANQQ